MGLIPRVYRWLTSLDRLNKQGNQVIERLSFVPPSPIQGARDSHRADNYTTQIRNLLIFGTVDYSEPITRSCSFQLSSAPKTSGPW